MVQKKIKIDGAEFTSIQPKGKIKNEDLKKIKVGYSKDSETRYISPVKINL